jgi:long-chain fatty acid transport protein
MPTGSHFAIKFLFTLTLLILASSSVLADEYLYELPLTRETSTNARATGMGSAYIAVSNDAAALHYNPAGLTRIGRVEFSGAITNVDRSFDVTGQGETLSSDMSRTEISAISFVYPFPTYQGSMVIALDYSSPYINDRLHRRLHPGDWTLETLEEGTVHEWNFGYAVEMAENISVGFTTSILTGDYYTDSSWLQPGIEEPLRLINDFSVSGFTGSLGAMARYNRNLSAGVVIDLPRWIEWDPFVTYEDDHSEELETQKLYYPFSVAAGVAGNWRKLLISGDVRFTDWSQIEYGHQPMRYRDDASGQSHYAYRQTVDLHLGVEYLLDTFLSGLRLRGGLAYQPTPYILLLQDVPDETEIIEKHAEASYSSEQLTFSVGGGLLIQEAMTLDVAFTYSTFTRELPLVVSEDFGETKIIVSAAFRMP